MTNESFSLLSFTTCAQENCVKSVKECFHLLFLCALIPSFLSILILCWLLPPCASLLFHFVVTVLPFWLLQSACPLEEWFLIFWVENHPTCMDSSLYRMWANVSENPKPLLCTTYLADSSFVPCFPFCIAWVTSFPKICFHFRTLYFR